MCSRAFIFLYTACQQASVSLSSAADPQYLRTACDTLISSDLPGKSFQDTFLWQRDTRATHLPQAPYINRGSDQFFSRGWCPRREIYARDLKLAAPREVFLRSLPRTYREEAAPQRSRENLRAPIVPPPFSNRKGNYGCPQKNVFSVAVRDAGGNLARASHGAE
jgi:hypothetical protein